MQQINTKFIDYKQGPAENLFLNERAVEVSP